MGMREMYKSWRLSKNEMKAADGGGYYCFSVQKCKLVCILVFTVKWEKVENTKKKKNMLNLTTSGVKVRSFKEEIKKIVRNHLIVIH